MAENPNVDGDAQEMVEVDVRQDTPMIPETRRTEPTNSVNQPNMDNYFMALKRLKDASKSRREFSMSILIFHFCFEPYPILQTCMTFIISVTIIVIGVLNMDQCSLERNIPIYLVVYGVIGLLKTIVLITKLIFARRAPSDRTKVTAMLAAQGALIILSLIWLIPGSVWTYSTLNDIQLDSPEDANYCHEIVYITCFVSTVSQFMALAWKLLPISVGLLGVYCCLENRAAAALNPGLGRPVRVQ